MFDLIMVALAVGFFVIAITYAAALDRV